jgi:hypothetical protein
MSGENGALRACGMMLARRLGMISVACLAGVLPSARAQSRPGEWLTIKARDFCVTEGAVEQSGANRVSVNVPKMRAYVKAATSSSVEIHFRYGGATQTQSALGSGQVRSQFGLKVRAQDPCNLVYVMWRVEPESQLVVSVKRNPGQHTSAQCGNRGYVNIKAVKASPVPMLKAGSSHTLRAEMKAAELRVYVDNKEVWEGSVGADAAALEGPVGIRSDNVRLEFEYLARGPETRGQHDLSCKTGESD